MFYFDTIVCHFFNATLHGFLFSICIYIGIYASVVRIVMFTPLKIYNGTNPTKNQKGLPFAECVNFGFGSSSKLPDDLLLLDK